MMITESNPKKNPAINLKGANMFNLEFNLDELHELHTTLVVRKCQLRAQLTHQNKDVAYIALRQLERVSPMLYYVESTVTEHLNHSTSEKVTA